MNENKVFDIVKKIFSKDEINHMAESLIIKSDIGYELYNKYCITKKDNRFQVIKFHTYTCNDFYSLRNAVIWTTFDKKNHIIDGNTIMILDMKLEGLDTNIEIYKNLCKTSKNYESKILYFTKLNEDKLKRKALLEKIESYSKQVKIWQEKMFEQAVK